MKHKPAMRLLVIWLVCLLVLGGCTPPAAETPPTESVISPHIVGGQVVVTERPPASTTNAYAPEKPAAGDNTALPPTTEPNTTAPATTAPPTAATTTAPPTTAPPTTATATTTTPTTTPPATTVPTTVATTAPTTTRATEPAREAWTNTSGREMRGVWISYLELGPMLEGRSESQFTASVEEMFANCKQLGLDTVFVQVRPFGDALYASDFFPWSHLATGTEGKNPGYDPLTILVRKARQHGLRIEAWLNPYRVRAAGNSKPLSGDNQAKKWLDAGDDSVISYEGTISYNPASEKAQELIINGAREILRRYDVDGIHIDDYFYPHTAADFDSAAYKRYTNGGGTMTLADWRRSNVESLIQKLYAAVKAEKPSALFGISPQSSVGNNYDAQYLDVRKIASRTGYCDYLCPQIYFGFHNDIQPFAETLDTWNDMTRGANIDLYVGLAVYKCGVLDSWAGSGSTEWRDNTDLLLQMLKYARTEPQYRGFILYRYDSAFRPGSGVRAHIEAEIDNLRSAF